MHDPAAVTREGNHLQTDVGMPRQKADLQGILRRVEKDASPLHLAEHPCKTHRFVEGPVRLPPQAREGRKQRIPEMVEKLPLELVVEETLGEPAPLPRLQVDP